DFLFRHIATAGNGAVFINRLIFRSLTGHFLLLIYYLANRAKALAPLDAACRITRRRAAGGCRAATVATRATISIGLRGLAHPSHQYRQPGDESCAFPNHVLSSSCLCACVKRRSSRPTYISGPCCAPLWPDYHSTIGAFANP